MLHNANHMYAGEEALVAATIAACVSTLAP